MLWGQGNGSKLPPDQVSRIERMLDVIDSAKQIPGDFDVFRNWSIHKLTGKYKDFWSIKVNKNYRIIFRFDGENAFDVDYIDYQ